MKPQRTIAAILFALFCVATAKAQIGAYAGFSGGHDTAASGTFYGPLLGIYIQTHSFLSFGADARGSFLTHSGAQFYTGAIGPRFSIKPPVLPIKPYVEGLVGVGGISINNSSSSTHLNYQILVGIDAAIFPHIDWRVIEYDYSAFTGNSPSASILTTGVVFRLP